MKKFFAIMVAMAALVAFTAPAWAAGDQPGPSFTVNGRMLTDLGYNMYEQQRVDHQKDVTSAFVNLAGHSYLRATFASIDKTTGGLVELGLYSMNSKINSVSLRYAYGWWKVGNCKLLAGQDDGWVGTLIHHPKQYLGVSQSGKLLLTNWGYTYSGRHPQVRFEWTSGQFGFALAAVQPGAGYVLPTGTDLYANLPRFDLAAFVKAGGFWTQPGIAWSQVKLEDVTGSTDNTFTQFMAILPVKFTAGPFTAKAEIHYGQNNDIELSGQLLSGLKTLPRSVPFAYDNGKVEDTKQIGGFLSAEYKIIPAWEIVAGFGIEQLTNDAWKKSEDAGGVGYKDDSYTRKAYFVALPYEVTKNFSVHPEFSYFDYGDNIKDSKDFGNEWLLGMQFKFVF